MQVIGKILAAFMVKPMRQTMGLDRMETLQIKDRVHEAAIGRIAIINRLNIDADNLRPLRIGIQHRVKGLAQNIGAQIGVPETLGDTMHDRIFQARLVEDRRIEERAQYGIVLGGFLRFGTDGMPDRIDLTQTGKDERGIPQFAANPGGAPANLAVAASRLGAQTAFIGKVGADAFGRYLKEVLAENKVDVSGMAVDADHPTTMAVVSVDATGERDFSFYRSANADVMLCKEDISDEALKAAKIVHFGSVSLTADPSRTATLDAAARAKKLGATITYDPNYRANLWKNKEDAIAQMKAPLPLVDILKVSDEELPLLTGTTDCESGTAQLAQNGIRLIFVTLGANGVFYRFGEKTGHVAGVPCKVGDTNGAGDTFFGAALSKLCKEELDTLTVDKLEGMLAFANKAASITTSRHGAIPAMPTLAEVEG